MMAMMVLMQSDAKTRKARLRRATAPGTRLARDIMADWKRWTLVERVIAATIVPAVVLTLLVMTTTLASGGH